MRTTLIKGALKRACDAPGCNHEWRQCPVHDVRQGAVQASPTCRGCGYHVCSCHRPAIDTETRGKAIGYLVYDEADCWPRNPVLADEILDRLGRARVTDNGEDAGVTLSRSEVLPVDIDSRFDVRACALRNQLMDRHDFSGSFADLVARHHTKPMFSVLMKAESVSAEISRKNPFVVFVEATLPPGGKFNKFFYRLDTEGSR